MPMNRKSFYGSLDEQTCKQKKSFNVCNCVDVHHVHKHFFLLIKYLNNLSKM